jgi:hypothetical protein
MQGERSALYTFKCVENAMRRLPPQILTQPNDQQVISEYDLETIREYGRGRDVSWTGVRLRRPFR